MGNELYCGLENGAHCSYSFFICAFFLSFKSKFVSQFFQKLCKLQSLIMAYIKRMSDCIVGYSLRLVALILPFFLYFFFPYFACIHRKFVSQFSLLKLES